MRALTQSRRWIVPIVIMGFLVAGLGPWNPFRTGPRTISADFEHTTGLYKGDEVRVLGVTVGNVTDVVPQGTTVRVRMRVDRSVHLPADVKAAIVAPSLVSGRFVQLSPAFTSGPQLQAGAVIPKSNTAVPVEFDQVKKELTELTAALGPNGVGGPNGSLNRLVDEVAANLGNGTAAQLKTSITAMRQAADTLVGGRTDLFTTVKNLDTFIRNLVINDGAVRSFSGQLAQFSTVLSDNRTQLATAVDALNQTLNEVKTFVNANHATITKSVSSLTTLAQTVADKSNSLASILQVAPFSVNDLYNTVEHNAIKGQVNLANVDSLAQVLCGSVLSVGGTNQDCQTALAPLVRVLGSQGLSLAGGGAGGLPVQLSPSAPSGVGGLGGVVGPIGGLTGLLNGSTGTGQSGSGLLGLLLPGGGA